ncbi:TaqI-like C-terminal specificity domain-containing protein [uncultured Alistipes sp.]|uniref:DUF7149 domain-containing protein n=1 Tax=uncultured Alistipes sp. TaxID=538949 RepID=UPI00261193B7|nr:TaqI-like C-terminal specificity domain-containing protein [uncultured Alistipes sp.]
MSQTEEPKYKILKPRQSILKAYLREPISETELTSFRTAMKTMLGRIDSSQHEEFNKNLVIDFFNQSLYKGNKYMVNTRDRADLAIYSESGQPAVLFEFKGPGRPDMVSKENLKEKALYELILYYIREEEKYHNTDIKHLIITNCWEYFIFDKKDFYQLFASNKQFVQRVLSSDNGSSKDGNDFIYNKIIKPYVENIETKLQFTYLNLHDFTGKIEKSNIVENKDFLAAYKLLSPAHLLKLPFSSDHNTLNTGFYQELLYIMGVEEVVEDRVHKIKRLRNDRQPYSLVEQVYSKLEDYSKITDDAQRFETALGLVLTWINRILFLKLLESQQESFNNNGEVRFLNTRHIKDYDVLNDLFFKVLAKPVKERSSEMMEQFPTVPYLNSSLFEMSQLEEEFFPISGIRMDEMDVFAKTVLRDGRGRKISGRKQTLDYLFEFLDAYDFGSERNTDKGLVRHESKTLINASVLGLIFEKINGYKDGSFFTPGYITQYICQETLRKAVVDKFNKKKGWNCSDFEDLKEHVDYGKREVRTEANEIINSLKICDPAVGSGHFLVSALNELIAIKSELGVLQDRQSQPQRIMDYEVRVELDELVITNEDGESYKYDPSSTTSQRIQETLFEEKRTIIENCLFGVDLNPKSVEICRLRLWIELLKNAYYYKDETGARQLQTLPNIDINIKSGDSLLHRFDLQESIYQVLRSTGITITQYRNAVAEYKNAHNKEVKRHLTELIERIKTILKSEIKQRDPELTKTQKQLSELQSQELFGAERTAEELAERHKKKIFLEKKIKRLEANIAKRKLNNKMYLNAFEWRIEFPEVLDNKGNFTGFDCIIGNPPYGVSITGPYRAAIVEGLDKVPDYEIYYYFIQIASQLLMENGLLSYIIPNTYLFNAYANNYRTNILNNWNIIEILDCTKFPIFESAVVRNTINIWQKGAVKNGVVGYRNTANASSFEDLITTPKEHITKPDLLDMNQNWGLAFYLPQTHIKIINKIGSCKNTIQSFFPDISQGLIAYDKYRGQSAEIIRTRAYHYSAYKEGLKRWLWGEDVKRYSVKWNGKEYIDYCEGIANPRQPKFFIGKRILVREITNPSIFAALTDDELYNDPSIIIIKDNLAYSLDIVLGILNSKLATFYHFNHSPKATKGIFPKILVQDIKDFPLPEIPNAEKSHMESLVTTILATKRENPQADTTSYEHEIDKTVFHLYGLTYDEVLIVDPNPPFTREEYEGKLN